MAAMLSPRAAAAEWARGGAGAVRACAGVQHGARRSRLRLAPKLILAVLAAGVVPMLVVAFIGLRVSGDPKTRAKATQQDRAATVLDVIDRNLFERYGDVQAFAPIRAEATRVRDDIPQVAASAEETGAAAEEVGNATTSVGMSSAELADMVGVFRVWNRGVPDRRARMRELEERDPQA